MAGTLTLDTLKASSGVLATQNGMTGIAKAWVNFNGSTQTIRSSFNVSSITRNGTGDYTLNFTTAMPSANYVPVHPSVHEPGVDNPSTVATYARTPNTQVLPTTTQYRFSSINTSATAIELTYCFVAIFGA